MDQKQAKQILDAAFFAINKGHAKRWREHLRRKTPLHYGKTYGQFNSHGRM